MILPHLKPKLSDNIYSEEIFQENDKSIYFILDSDKPSWTFVNNDGKAILDLCNGENSIEDISKNIVSKYHQIDEKACSQIVSSFLEQMKKSQILYNKPIKSPSLNTFHGIALEITKACNLRCKHCYLAAGELGENELSLDEIKSLLRVLKNNGGISVAIGGGEPLLRDDCLEIIEYALSLELLVSLGTNGTLITLEMAKKLSKLPIKIQISLDGATKEIHERIRGKGTYDATLQGINYLVNEGMAKDLIISFTPMKVNVYEVEQMIEFALKRSIPVIQFPPLSASGRAQNKWDELVLSDDEKFWFWSIISKKSQELQGKMDLLADCFSININNIGTQHKCTIGSQFRIDPEGNVYPCQCFHVGTEYSLGNLKEKSLQDMIMGQKVAQIKKSNMQRPSMIEECNACKWKNFCGAGCMGNAYERTKTIYSTTSCELRKKWIENLFEAKIDEAVNRFKYQEALNSV